MRIEPVTVRLPSVVLGLEREAVGDQLRLANPTTGRSLLLLQEARRASAAARPLEAPRRREAEAALQETEFARQMAETARQQTEAASPQSEAARRQAEAALPGSEAARQKAGAERL